MYRVMVVDDDQWALKDIRAIFKFQKHGFHDVAYCNNVEEALRTFEHLYPDLLITDIQMDGINGVELMKCCRGMKPDLITVLVSGYQNFAFAKAAVNAGAFYYMLKPLDEDEATQVLQKCFAKLSEKGVKQEESQITRICTYVSEHLSLSLKLSEIAKEFYMNSSYLSELFQSRMGMSFTQYKRDKILENAMKMLQQEDARIHDVAEACGFQDVHYFSKWFKAQTKLCPREYKRRIGGK